MLALRQWRANARLTATGTAAEGALFLADYGLRGLRVVVLFSLWRTVFAGHGASAPMELGAVLTYTLIGEVFAEQLSARTTIADAFWQGTITQHFLRPMNVVSQFASEMLGGWLVSFACFSLPLLLAAPLLDVDPRPHSLAAALWFCTSLGLSISVGLALDFAFASLTVALEQPVWLVQWVRFSIHGLLAGALIPLALYPWGLGELFAWLPFASLAWAPLAIYTGIGDPLRLVGLQLCWSLALWPLAGWLWRANREKVVGYGG
jgi:ABC-type uncharacterized transport system permease subunit